MDANPCCIKLPPCDAVDEIDGHLGAATLSLFSGGSWVLDLPGCRERGLFSTFAVKKGTSGSPDTLLCTSESCRTFELKPTSETDFFVQINHFFPEWMKNLSLLAAGALQSEFRGVLRFKDLEFDVDMTLAGQELVMRAREEFLHKGQLKNTISDIGLDSKVTGEEKANWEKTMDELDTNWGASQDDGESPGLTWALDYTVRLPSQIKGQARECDGHWYYCSNEDLLGVEIELNEGKAGLSELLARSLEAIGHGQGERDEPDLAAIVQDAALQFVLSRHFPKEALPKATTHEIRKLQVEPSCLDCGTAVWKQPTPLLALSVESGPSVAVDDHAVQKMKAQLQRSDCLFMPRHPELGTKLDFTSDHSLGKFQGMMARQIVEGKILVCMNYDGAYDPQVAKEKGNELAQEVVEKMALVGGCWPSGTGLVSMSDGCWLIFLVVPVVLPLAAFAAGVAGQRFPNWSPFIEVGAFALNVFGGMTTGVVAASVATGAAAGAPFFGIGALVGAVVGGFLGGLGLVAGYYAGRPQPVPAAQPLQERRRQVIDVVHMRQGIDDANRHLALGQPGIQENVNLVAIPPADQAAEQAQQEGPQVLAGQDEAATGVAQGHAENEQDGLNVQLPAAPVSYEQLRQMIPAAEEWLRQNIQIEHFDVILAYRDLNACGLLFLCSCNDIYNWAQRLNEKFASGITSRRSHLRDKMHATGNLLHDIGTYFTTTRATLQRGKTEIDGLKRFRGRTRDCLSVDVPMRLLRLSHRVSEHSVRDSEMIQQTARYLQRATAAFETLIPTLDTQPTVVNQMIQQVAAGAANQAGRELITLFFGGLLHRRG